MALKTLKNDSNFTLRPGHHMVRGRYASPNSDPNPDPNPGFELNLETLKILEFGDLRKKP